MAGVNVNSNPAPAVPSGQEAYNAELSAPVDVNPIYAMSPSGILEYCEAQMSSINSQFNEQVAGLQQMNNDSTMLGTLKAAISGVGPNGLNMAPTGSNPSDEATWSSIDTQINSDIAVAKQEGNSQLVASLTSIKTTFETDGTTDGGTDHVVSPNEITDITNAIDTASSNITANQQIAMTNVNQIASDQNSMLTQMTQMLAGMDQTELKIAGNA
jgi:multidrug resistance efflux pump